MVARPLKLRQYAKPGANVRGLLARADHRRCLNRKLRFGPAIALGRDHLEKRQSRIRHRTQNGVSKPWIGRIEVGDLCKSRESAFRLQFANREGGLKADVRLRIGSQREYSSRESGRLF